MSNIIIIVGTISLLGAAGKLAQIVLKKVVDRASDRHIRKEKETQERIDTLRLTFTTFLLELEKAGMIHFDIIASERKRHDEALLNCSHFLKGTRRDRFNEKRQEYQRKMEAYEKHARQAIVRAYFPDFPAFLEEDEKQYKKELKQLIEDICKIAENK